MNQLVPPTQLAPQPSGNTKEVTWFKQVMKNIRERTVTVGPGLRCSYTTEGTRIEVAAKAARGGAGDPTGCKRCKITAILPTGTNQAHYLTTKEYNVDGYTVSNTTLLVAIPYYLRADTYPNSPSRLTLGGFSYTTVAGQIRCSNAPGSDTAYVVKSFFPPYGIGQDIYAIQPIGKTDVTVDDNLLEWIDANVEGRRLDTAQTQLSVCRLEGSPAVEVTRNVVVEGGPVF